MNLLAELRGRRQLRRAGLTEEAARAAFVEIFQSWQSKTERIQHDFVNYVQEGYKNNGVVFSVILARLLLFSEARFIFRHRTSHEFLHTPALTRLEQPWRNGTTGELLARMEQDASLAGNAYIARSPEDRLQRLRPDWVDIVTDGQQVIGYLYNPNGTRDPSKAKVFLPDEIAHWSPIPDPEANFRGMSWLTPIVREVNADTAMTRHKGKFFDNAATPNLLVKVQGKLEDAVRERLEAKLKMRHEGVDNAYKTLLLEGGADVQVVGANFEQMTFATVQAAGENRIAVAGGVPGIIVGLKEGLQAATYSNYSQARRRFADLTMRPNWRSAAAALAALVPAPDGYELWYDDRDIPALKEDAKEAAEIFKIKAETAGSLIRAGYAPTEVGKVVETGRGLDTLSHSGAIPVTLYQDGQEPGTPKDV